MARIDRTRDDLKGMLVEQVTLLQLSCEAFDKGVSAAAKQMSTTLRVLLHHLGRSRSLLHQLGLREGRFYDCGFSSEFFTRGDQVHKLPQCRLVGMYMDGGSAKYLPMFDPPGGSRKVPFPDWWTGMIVIDTSKRTLSRLDLVANIADTDGGAHVDPSLEEKYLDFSRRNSLGWRFGEPGKAWADIPAPHLPAVRAIAHEVLITLQESAPWAFAQAYTFTDPMKGLTGAVFGGMEIAISDPPPQNPAAG
jgi:hypothetical protein